MNITGGSTGGIAQPRGGAELAALRREGGNDNNGNGLPRKGGTPAETGNDRAAHVTETAPPPTAQSANAANASRPSVAATRTVPYDGPDRPAPRATLGAAARPDATDAPNEGVRAAAERARDDMRRDLILSSLAKAPPTTLSAP